MIELLTVKDKFINMDKKAVHHKSSLINLKFGRHSKRKTTKNSSARTPTHLESIFDQKSIHLSKFKTNHSKPEREGVRSVMPTFTNLFNENQSENARKVYKTNQTEIDIPHSHSEKTITIRKQEEKTKESSKCQKTNKKGQNKKTSKIQIELFESGNQYLTTRKSSVKKTNLKSILRRTEKLLQNYQRREEQWLRQKENLVQQVQQMRRKESGKKCMTHSSSAYMSKKQLY